MGPAWIYPVYDPLIPLRGQKVEERRRDINEYYSHPVRFLRKPLDRLGKRDPRALHDKHEREPCYGLKDILSSPTIVNPGRGIRAIPEIFYELGSRANCASEARVSYEYTAIYLEWLTRVLML
ncbi:hypothetical protein SERLADRAFT_435257 [Serpula lacrymans var. lacrymans S7.9]|uniref:Uncharacterized protein n=1 Tax=Serpula lacrymans var. lacrymans (strain S7.9) TaxID=578457 RepID=F8NMY5_SERL9|nr:uncharacterized protein SERLADRAFT_435257 [Serpula lacrymans var. lacrymans S7.9]EGO27479.1 hypothetical protein SERLADRAFT_435257 [Serpula lacrymans var. lacrymans S7.9]